MSSENFYSTNINYYGNILASIFLVTSFLNRTLASIILIGLLLFLIYFFIKSFKYKEYKHLYNSILLILLSLCVINFAYHDASARYIDNFTRLLILLPLLMLRYNEDFLEKTIMAISLAALFHFTFLNLDISYKYEGTSSTSLTYGHMLSIIICVHIYQIVFKQHSFLRKIFLIISLLLTVFLYSKAASTGTILGLFLFMIYVVYKSKSKNYMIMITLPVILIILQSPIGTKLNDMYDDIKNINQTYLYDSSTNKSLRERILYSVYAFQSIKEKPLSGIGPQNIIQDTRTFMVTNGYAADKNKHLHNEYLDIAVKFGLLPLLALVYFYYSLYLIFRKDNNILGLIVLTLILCANFTQAHFIHHQSIIFCTTLLYIFINLNKRLVNSA